MNKSRQRGIAGFSITPSAETSRWQCSNVAAVDCGDDVQLASLDPVEPQHEAPLEPHSLIFLTCQLTFIFN